MPTPQVAQRPTAAAPASVTTSVDNNTTATSSTSAGEPHAPTPATGGDSSVPRAPPAGRAGGAGRGRRDGTSTVPRDGSGGRRSAGPSSRPRESGPVRGPSALATTTTPTTPTAASTTAASTGSLPLFDDRGRINAAQLSDVRRVTIPEEISGPTQLMHRALVLMGGYGVRCR